MSNEGKIKLRLDSGEFKVNKKGIIVCSFCGGNCGQCGNTELIGNPPFDFDIIAKNVFGDSEKKKLTVWENIKDWLANGTK